MRQGRDGGGLTRRQFVKASALGGTALVVGCTARNRGGLDFLNDAESRTLAAICDQIIPADDFPSASEAGVLVYIDRQLARHYRRHRNTYRDGIGQADAMSRRLFGRDLDSVSAQQQTELVTGLAKENPGFFNLVRSHTFEGYYGPPRHGGNRNAVSWRMLGMAEPPIRGRAQYDLRKGPTS